MNWVFARRDSFLFNTVYCGDLEFPELAITTLSSYTRSLHVVTWPSKNVPEELLNVSTSLSRPCLVQFQLDASWCTQAKHVAPPKVCLYLLPLCRVFSHEGWPWSWCLPGNTVYMSVPYITLTLESLSHIWWHIFSHLRSQLLHSFLRSNEKQANLFFPLLEIERSHVENFEKFYQHNFRSIF